MSRQTNELTDGYPLRWPAGFPRTDPADRKSWPDRGLTLGKAKKTLLRQLATTGAEDVVLSCDIKRRKDNGMPYANARKPEDPGVAVYFTLKGGPRVLPFDRYQSIEDNIRAAAVTIRDMRRIAGRGPSDFLERAYTGFKAIAETSGGRSWWDVLGVARNPSRADVVGGFKQRAKQAHPDRGGSRAAWDELQEAFGQGKAATQPNYRSVAD